MSEVPPNKNTATPPNPSATPPPAPEKQALIIAKSFIKTYYHTLSTSPEEIYKFYKNDVSQLSYAEECNTPSELVTPGISSEKHTTFLTNFQNAMINFENGSIDAQMSWNGGILLVVTGYMTLVSSKSEQRFVHSFFLSHESKQGVKKHFFVLNDVFRFLTEVKEENDNDNNDEIAVKEGVEDGEEVANDIPVEEDNGEEVVVVKEEQEEDVVIEKTNKIEKLDDDGETATTSLDKKEVVIVEESTSTDEEQLKSSPVENNDIIETTIEEVLDTESDEDEEVVVEVNKPNSSSTDTALFPSPVASKPKTPGSWASLVAGGGKQSSEQQDKVVSTKPTTTTASTSKKDNVIAPSSSVSEAGSSSEVVVPEKEVVVTTRANRTSRSSNADRQGSSSSKHSNYNKSSSHSSSSYEPSSLYIKNISDDLKETDLRELFKSYGHKIVNGKAPNLYFFSNPGKKSHNFYGSHSKPVPTTWVCIC